MTGYSLKELARRVIECERCPRLREHCRQVAEAKRAAYRDWDYHGRPVPSFGDPKARLLIVGLAPGAHGANRTGRMFTGDRSGDFLYKCLHKVGIASQPHARSADDGLCLRGALITAACRCAPPANKPTAAELDQCGSWLEATVDAMKHLSAVVCLGQIAYNRWMRLATARGWGVPRPRPAFGHGVRVVCDGGPDVFGCYHPSQQNTFTGRLTESMMVDVFNAARSAAGLRPSVRPGSRASA